MAAAALCTAATPPLGAATPPLATVSPPFAADSPPPLGAATPPLATAMLPLAANLPHTSRRREPLKSILEARVAEEGAARLGLRLSLVNLRLRGGAWRKQQGANRRECVGSR